MRRAFISRIVYYKDNPIGFCAQGAMGCRSHSIPCLPLMKLCGIAYKKSVEPKDFRNTVYPKENEIWMEGIKYVVWGVDNMTQRVIALKNKVAKEQFSQWPPFSNPPWKFGVDIVWDENGFYLVGENMVLARELHLALVKMDFSIWSNSSPRPGLPSLLLGLITSKSPANTGDLRAGDLA